MNELKNKKSKNKKPDKITLPITYPNERYPETNIAKPSDKNVEIAKEWVDDGSRL